METTYNNSLCIFVITMVIYFCINLLKKILKEVFSYRQNPWKKIGNSEVISFTFSISKEKKVLYKNHPHFLLFP